MDDAGSLASADCAGLNHNQASSPGRGTGRRPARVPPGYPCHPPLPGGARAASGPQATVRCRAPTGLGNDRSGAVPAAPRPLRTQSPQRPPAATAGGSPHTSRRSPPAAMGHGRRAAAARSPATASTTSAAQPPPPRQPPPTPPATATSCAKPATYRRCFRVQCHLPRHPGCRFGADRRELACHLRVPVRVPVPPHVRPGVRHPGPRQRRPQQAGQATPLASHRPAPAGTHAHRRASSATAGHTPRSAGPRACPAARRGRGASPGPAGAVSPRTTAQPAG